MGTRLVLVTLTAIVLAGARPAEDPARVLIELPPEGAEWVRVDLPPAFAARIGSARTRVEDAEGRQVPHLVLGRRAAPGRVRIEWLPRDVEAEAADAGAGPHLVADPHFVADPQSVTRLGLLPGPEEAPDRLLVECGTGPVALSVGLDADRMRPLVLVGEPPRDAGGRAIISLPPMAGGVLGVAARDLRDVFAEWDGAANDPGVPLAPRVVGRRRLPRAQEFLIDLRVARAADLRLEFDLEGLFSADPIALDASDPDARAAGWQPLHCVAGSDGEGRFRARVRAPGGASQRWVRVIVPSTDPDALELRNVVATVRAARLFVRRHGLIGPLTLSLEDGVPEAEDGAPPYVMSWDAGAAAKASEPPFLAPLGYGRRAPTSDAGRGGRPFPGAELIATVLFAALAIWAFLARCGG